MAIFVHPDRYATPRGLASERWQALRYALSGGIVGAVADLEDVWVLVVIPTLSKRKLPAASFCPLVRWINVKGEEWQEPTSALYDLIMQAADPRRL